MNKEKVQNSTPDSESRTGTKTERIIARKRN